MTLHCQGLGLSGVFPQTRSLLDQEEGRVWPGMRPVVSEQARREGVHPELEMEATTCY